MPPKLLLKYEKLLDDEEILEPETLKANLVLNDNFLQKIGIKNVDYIVKIKDAVGIDTDVTELGDRSSMTFTRKLPSGAIVHEKEVVPNFICSGIHITNVKSFRVKGAALKCQLYSGDFKCGSHIEQVLIKCNTNYEELKHEASVYRALNSSQNSCCVSMHCFDEAAAATPYMVLPMFGKSLCDYMVPNSLFRDSILNQLANSVLNLHSAGYVHGDLKPANVLVLDQGNGQIVVKLCDFDSASVVGEPFIHDPATKLIKFTPEWVSPEVYFGVGGSLIATCVLDVFNLGLLAAALLAPDCSYSKAILPSQSDVGVSAELCLTDETELIRRLNMKSAVSDMVISMCRIDPTLRPDMATIASSFGMSRTVYVKKFRDELSSKDRELGAKERELEFVKHEIGDQLGSIAYKLDELKVEFAAFGDEMRQASAGMQHQLQVLSSHQSRLNQGQMSMLQQLGATDAKVEAMLRGAYEIPTFILMLPYVEKSWVASMLAKPMSFVRDKYKMLFVCSHSLRIAPCGPDGDGYTITVTKKSIRPALPVLKALAVVASVALAAHGMPLPLAQMLNVADNMHEKYMEDAMQFMDMDVVGDMGSALADSAQQLLDRGKVDTKEAFDCIKSMLSGCGLDIAGIRGTCGLEQVISHGAVGWVIKGDAAVKEAFIASSAAAAAAGSATESLACGLPSGVPGAVTGGLPSGLPGAVTGGLPSGLPGAVSAPALGISLPSIATRRGSELPAVLDRSVLITASTSALAPESSPLSLPSISAPCSPHSGAAVAVASPMFAAANNVFAPTPPTMSPVDHFERVLLGDFLHLATLSAMVSGRAARGR